MGNAYSCLINLVYFVYYVYILYSQKYNYFNQGLKSKIKYYTMILIHNNNN